jgi:outer membrane biosynthesis protein TonB
MGLIAVLLLLSQVRAGVMPGPKMTHYVRPVYPRWARTQHIEGCIEFVASIGKDGRVRDLSFVKGPKLLVPFAQTAIGKWRYQPATLNGEQVEVRTAINVNFTLSQ